jgi:predicted PurR-regulated permease PerM
MADSANSIKKISVDISFGTVVKSVVFLLLLVALYYIRDIVAIILFSIVIASGIEPALSWFEKRKIPRVVTLLALYIFIIALFAAFVYMIVPIFMDELSAFSERLPSYLENPKEWQTLFGFVPNLPTFFSSLLGKVFMSLHGQMGRITEGFDGASQNLLGGAVSFGLVTVLSFYLAVQKNGLENMIQILTPQEYEKYILDLWSRSRKKIGLWLQGQILLAALVGIMVFLGLTILGIPYAMVFAVLAGMFEIIPVFGPILAAIPPVAVAFLESPALAVTVVIFYVIIQQFENHLIYPLVVRKIVGIPPILTIISLLIGGKLAGFFGMLLSIPLVTTLKVFLDDLAEKKKIKLG